MVGYFWGGVVISSSYAANHEATVSSGIVVILNGTGSVGKSTISRDLCEQWNVKNKKVKIVEKDQVAQEVLKSIVNPKDIDFDVKHPMAVLFKNYLNRFGSERLNNLLEQINLTIAKRANEFLVDNNCIVVIDSSFDSQKAIENARAWFSKNIRVFHVLVYCSLPTLLEHVIKRNKANIATEKRDILYIIERYMKIYSLQPDPAKLALDSISKNDFYDFVLKAKAQGQYSGIEHKEIINKFDKACETFICNFGLFQSYRLHIVPNLTYDFAVNNDKKTTKEIARQIECFVDGQSNIPGKIGDIASSC